MPALSIPEKLEPFLAPARFKAAYGGRGSGKTRSIAQIVVAGLRLYGSNSSMMRGYRRFMCVREIQRSIAGSSFQVLKDEIARADYTWRGRPFFTWTNTEIRGINGARAMFMGVRHNPESVKSQEGIDGAWGEEADSLSGRSMTILVPTIRDEGSEMFFSWNPSMPEDPVDAMFRGDAPPARAAVVEIGHRDNPWFPEVLEEARQFDLQHRPDLYEHIWEGGYWKASKAQVFNGCYRVDDFEPQTGWAGPMFGLDFGFSIDPTAAVEVWIGDDRLWIRRCVGAVGLELDDTPRLMLDSLPEIDAHTIRADSAWPQSIAHLKRHGLPRIEPVEKWPGSVEEGVKYMRGAFREIVIHPDCEAVVREFGKYSYKVNPLTMDPMPQIIDADNHYIDAVRYAIAPIIRRKAAPKMRAL